MQSTLKRAMALLALTGLSLSGGVAFSGCGNPCADSAYSNLCGSEVCDTVRNCCDSAESEQAKNACSTAHRDIQSLRGGPQESKNAFCSALQGSLGASCQ